MRNLALFLLLLAACTPAARSTASPLPTAISTLTGTPVPPLAAHEWSQSEPLITFDKSAGGLGSGYFDGVFPVEFTLLPSGNLYLLRGIENLGDYVILTTKLSRKATCYLLNSIDQAGFFDYDPSSYDDPSRYMTAYPGRLKPGARLLPGPSDSGATLISVQAWRANSVGLFNLNGSLWVEAENQLRGTPAPVYPIMLPAIRVTFRLLDQYQPLGTLHVLKPERLGVWLRGSPAAAETNDFIKWPLKSHTLAAVGSVERYGAGPPFMILTGEDATQVYDALGEFFNAFGTFNVREGDKLYNVLARPLLPNEFNPSPLPKVSLSCSPSDGWIQAP